MKDEKKDKKIRFCDLSLFQDVETKKVTMGVLNSRDGKIYSFFPYVDSIEYDEDNKCFFVTDTLDGGVIKIFYFIDLYGNVIGTGFTNDSHAMLDVKLRDEKDTYPYENYDIFKASLLKELIQEKNQLERVNKENSIKMLKYKLKK